MEKVTGIGGFFFRAENPGDLNAWYEEHLGIRVADEGYDKGSWWQDEGPTVFAAERMKPNFGRPDQNWSINFRVNHLDAMVVQLRAAGISVEVDEKVYPNGRFANLCDPEGNCIELWEAGGNDSVRQVP